MKVYIVTHYIDCEYDNIEKVFSSKEKAEEYQELMREKYKCSRYYTSRKGEKLYIIEDFYVDEYEVESFADRPQGEWIYCEDEYGIDGYRCSNCGRHIPWDYQHKFINFIDDYHTCPFCNARMKGIDDEMS